MEKLTSWWQSRSVRDKRALVALGLFLPALMFWYFVTLPLIDRLKIQKRILTTKNTQAEEFQKLCNDLVKIRSKKSSFKLTSSPKILEEVESILNKNPEIKGKFLINRSSLFFAGKTNPAAEIRFEGMSSQSLLTGLNEIIGGGVKFSRFEIKKMGNSKNSLSGSAQIYK